MVMAAAGEAQESLKNRQVPGGGPCAAIRKPDSRDPVALCRPCRAVAATMGGPMDSMVSKPAGADFAGRGTG